MKFVLYCESNLDNINDIVKAVENTGKLSVKNVYVSVEQVLDKIDEVEKDNKPNIPVLNQNIKNKAAHKPHIAYPKNNGWEEYDKISNMPTL